MRVIKLLLLSGLLLLASCGVRVPTNIDRAKRKVEQNYNQIKAIVDYHDLADPTYVRDTIKTVVPRYVTDFNIKSPNFLSALDTSFYRYVAPFLEDGTDVQKVYKDLSKAVAPELISYTYEDSLVIVRVDGYPDDLKFNVELKEREVSKPIEYRQDVINTEVKWYEDRFVKVALLALILGAVASVIMLIIKKGAN